MIGRRLHRSVDRIRGVMAIVQSRANRPPARELAEIPDLVGGPNVRHDAALDVDPSVVVLMPHLSVGRMTGGPNTVFQITERLAARGLTIRYVACFGALDADVTALRRHLHDLTGIVRSSPSEFLDRSQPDATLFVGRGDVMLATWWPTAHVANRALAVTEIDAFIYLIQDFEPGFHPWSTKYVLAASTYDMSFRAIVNEPTLLEYLRAQGHLGFDAGDPERAIPFMPAVDRVAFRPGDRQPGRRRFVFYARPKHPRNLFDLGLQALVAAVEQGAFDEGDWEFVAIGGETRAWTLPGGHTLEPLPRLSYRDYAAYLGESDVLLSLMLSPHTSYPPLEMAAAGGLVITNTFGTKTAEAMAAISPAIRGVHPDVESLASAIARAVEDVSIGGQRRHPTTSPSSWEESLEKVIPWLEATVVAARGRAVR
jgi:O-antigen biosynthesis protein